MRVTLRSAAALAALTLTLAACGSDGGDNAEESPSEAPKASGSLTIWVDDERVQPLNAVKEQFEKDTGVKVKLVQKEFGDVRDDFVTQVPTGKGPDIIVGAHDWLGKLVQNGVVAPLEIGDKADEFQQVAIDAMSYEGKVYGLPFSVENIALVRNTALAADAPATFQDALATGKQLITEGKAKYPFLVQQDPTNGDPYHLYPLQASFGAPVFGLDSDGAYDPSKLEIGNAGGQEFAKLLAQLGAEKVLTDSISYDIAKEAFTKGQAPFIITGPWMAADFVKAGMDIAIDPIPSAGGEKATPFVGVQGFFVSAKSENPLLANEFVVNYLSTQESQEALYEVGGRPPALTAAFDAVQDDELVAGFGSVGADGVPMPSIPAMDAVWSSWGTTELAIIQGKGDPVQLWLQMTDTIAKSIAGS
jgi:arabinogalactan oligomer / maltooligosaccharide transport system substrate-binding protein